MLRKLIKDETTKPRWPRLINLSAAISSLILASKVCRSCSWKIVLTSNKANATVEHTAEKSRYPGRKAELRTNCPAELYSSWATIGLATSANTTTLAPRDLTAYSMRSTHEMYGRVSGLCGVLSSWSDCRAIHTHSLTKIGEPSLTHPLVTRLGLRRPRQSLRAQATLHDLPVLQHRAATG